MGFEPSVAGTAARVSDTGPRLGRAGQAPCLVPSEPDRYACCSSPHEMRGMPDYPSRWTRLASRLMKVVMSGAGLYYSPMSGSAEVSHLWPHSL